MKLTFSKKQIEILKEGNEFVQPMKANSTIANVGADIQRASQGTLDKHFVIDTEKYDGNSADDDPNFSVKAVSPQDAQKKLMAMKQNPDVAKIMDKGATVEIDLDGNMQESVIRYTKGELNKILFR